MPKALHILLFIIPFFLISCGNRKALTMSGDRSNDDKRAPVIEHDLLDQDVNTPAKDTSNQQRIYTQQNTALYALIEEWKGTPHKMGGNSKSGVDCSGLVCIIYDEVYANSFKYRRARDIFTEVEVIEKEDLQEGDLVFFKIHNRSIDHVGVYLKDGDFLHSSSSRGVMISNLEEDYYKKRFFKGGRKKG